MDNPIVIKIVQLERALKIGSDSYLGFIKSIHKHGSCQAFEFLS